MHNCIILLFATFVLLSSQKLYCTGQNKFPQLLTHFFSPILYLKKFKLELSLTGHLPNVTDFSKSTSCNINKLAQAKASADIWNKLVESLLLFSDAATKHVWSLFVCHELVMDLVMLQLWEGNYPQWSFSFIFNKIMIISWKKWTVKMFENVFKIKGKCRQSCLATSSFREF